MKSRIQHSKYMFFILVVCIMLSGCGESKKAEELNTYRESMNAVLTNIADLNDTMNEIDTSDADCIEILLNCFDSLENECKTLSEIPVPDQFASIEELADEAYEYMCTTNTMYHEAFAEDQIDSNIAQAAYEYYDRVGKRIRFIVQILHGETPEGEGVTVTTNTTTTTPLQEFNEAN